MRVIGDIRRLGGGTAACEELSLCYWAGSAFKVDFFNYGQKLATSALPRGGLRGNIFRAVDFARAGQFSARRAAAVVSVAGLV